MRWTIETLDKRVDAEIAALPPSLSARLVRLTEMVGSVGLENVHLPHVKQIDGKLWELRAKARDGIARALYVTVKDRRVVILRVFAKKTQQTPAREIAIARERMKEVKT